MSGIAITDKDYPARVAYTLINKIMTDYENHYTSSAWKQVKSDEKEEPEFMKKDIVTYQNPAEADKLTKIQKNLDDIKDIMHKNIEQVLQRGETLDSLMDKSQDLSATSVQFYKKSKATNACCKAY
jgi:synaptobrevin family protein YKT6